MPLAQSVPIVEDDIAAMDATVSPVHDLLPAYRVRVSTDSQSSIDDELKDLDGYWFTISRKYNNDSLVNCS